MLGAEPFSCTHPASNGDGQALAARLLLLPFGEIADDLIRNCKREICRVDLDNRPIAGESQAQRSAENPVFRDRRLDDLPWTELLEQPPRCSGCSGMADGFAEIDGSPVARQFTAQHASDGVSGGHHRHCRTAPMLSLQPAHGALSASRITSST